MVQVVALLCAEGCGQVTDMPPQESSSHLAISSDGRPLFATYPRGSVILGNLAGQLGVYPEGGVTLAVGEMITLANRIQGLSWAPFTSSNPSVLQSVAPAQGTVAAFRAIKPGEATIMVVTVFCRGHRPGDHTPCLVLPVTVVA